MYFFIMSWVHNNCILCSRVQNRSKILIEYFHWSMDNCTRFHSLTAILFIKNCMFVIIFSSNQIASWFGWLFDSLIMNIFIMCILVHQPQRHARGSVAVLTTICAEVRAAKNKQECMPILARSDCHEKFSRQTRDHLLQPN